MHGLSVLPLFFSASQTLTSRAGKSGIASHETLEVENSYQKAKHSQCHINISVTKTSTEVSLIEASRPQATLVITTLEEGPEEAEMDQDHPSHSMAGKL